jgi:hypothetical protein
MYVCMFVPTHTHTHTHTHGISVCARAGHSLLKYMCYIYIHTYIHIYIYIYIYIYTYIHKLCARVRVHEVASWQECTCVSSCPWLQHTKQNYFKWGVRNWWRLLIFLIFFLGGRMGQLLPVTAAQKKNSFKGGREGLMEAMNPINPGTVWCVCV